MSVINAKERFRQNCKPEPAVPRLLWIIPGFAMSALIALLVVLALQFFGVLR